MVKRRMLSDINALYIQEIMQLIEKQSKETISKWCITYAKENIIPIWNEYFPDDNRPSAAIIKAEEFLDGKRSIQDIKSEVIICRNLAKEIKDNIIAEGSIRAIASAITSLYNPPTSLGIVLYGALMIAYYKVGVNASLELIDTVAIDECIKMKESLLRISVEKEENPVKIKWNC